MNWSPCLCPCPLQSALRPAPIAILLKRKSFLCSKPSSGFQSCIEEATILGPVRLCSHPTPLATYTGGCITLAPKKPAVPPPPAFPTPAVSAPRTRPPGSHALSSLLSCLQSCTSQVDHPMRTRSPATLCPSLPCLVCPHGAADPLPPNIDSSVVRLLSAHRQRHASRALRSLPPPRGRHSARRRAGSRVLVLPVCLSFLPESILCS